MRRFVCFSLCLGLIASACKKKSPEENLNKARAEGKAGGDSGGGGTSGTTTVTKKDKAAVIKFCLPQINTMLRAEYSQGQQYFVLRQNTSFETTAEAPSLLLYTAADTPLEFDWDDAFGLGDSQAAVTANLNAMVADADVQGQFVARADNAKGWRVFISGETTFGPELEDTGPNEPYPAPGEGAIYKIYDRESTITANGLHTVPAVDSIEDAHDENAGWYDCAVDDDDNVTLVYTETPLT